MPDRKAAIAHAEANWFRPCADGMVTALQMINVADQYRHWALDPTKWKPVFLNYQSTAGFKPDGLFFVPNEDATVDNLIKNGMDASKFPNKRFVCSWSDSGPDKLDDGQMPRYWGLNDCAHFLSECLGKGGYSVATRSAPELVQKLQQLPITQSKTLAYLVPASAAKLGIKSGVMKPGDCIFFGNSSGHLHSSLFVGDENIIAHTWSAHPSRPGPAYKNQEGHNWELSVNVRHSLVTLIHFTDGDSAPAKETWLHGWWLVRWLNEVEFYHFDNQGRCQWSKAPPAGPDQAAFSNPDGRGYWFSVDGRIVVCWTKTGSVEKYSPVGTTGLAGTYNNSEPITAERIR